MIEGHGAASLACVKVTKTVEHDVQVVFKKAFKASLGTDLTCMKQCLGQVYVFGSVTKGLSFCRLPTSPSQKQQERTWISIHPYEVPAHPHVILVCLVTVASQLPTL